MDFLTLLFLVSNILLTFSQCPKNSINGMCTLSPYNLMIDGKICAEECPSQYTKVCTVSQTPICSSCTLPPYSSALFALEFWKIQDLSATFIESSVNSADKWSNPSSVPYNSPTKYSPFPTRSRGFYFGQTSSISSNQNYIPSIYFTAALWILPVGNGKILAANFGSNYLELTYYYNTGFSFNVIGQNYNTGANEPKLVNILADQVWYYLVIEIKQKDCSTLDLMISLNNDTDTTITMEYMNSIANFTNGNYVWTIGKSDAYSFTGFIYWIKAWNVLTYEYLSLNMADLCTITIYDNQCIKCDTNNVQGCSTTCSSDDQINDDCTSCYSKQCAICYGYSADMCSQCSYGIEPTCCDWLADTCKSTWNSTTCSIGTVLIDWVCLYAIPYGFVNSLPVNTPVISADFTTSFTGIYDNILVTGESSSTYNYWNSPESVDPFPAKQRGLYFIPNTYLKATINLFHTFSIGIWVYPISGYYLKYTSNQMKAHSGGTIEIIMQNFIGNSQIYSTSISTSLKAWNCISFSVEYLYNGTSTITPYINAAIGAPYTVQEGIFRPLAGETLYLGSDNFNGFISLFQLWQIAISDFNSFWNYFGANPDQSILWHCDFDEFFDGDTCTKCLNSCQNGCATADSCNFCDGVSCLQCSSFEANSCTLSCGSGYYPDGQIQCSPCYVGCSHCTGSLYYQCTSCNSGYYYYSALGACLSDCPMGYTISGSECLIETELIFDLNLNTLSGVVYDKANLIQVVTGSSEQFYPNYEDDDPKSAYLRGFYFDGKSSVVRLPEYKTYTSPKLKVGPIFTISIWLNAENEDSYLISKNDISDNYSTIYAISLASAKPALQILINKSIFTYSSDTTINSFDWSHIALQVNIDSTGNSVATWYVNAHPSSSLILGFGYFQDILSNVASLIGAKQTSQDLRNFFQGFLYEIRIYNNIHAIEALSQTSCFESCDVCNITKSCIPNCKFTEFWEGPKYNNCLKCNSNCMNGCKDSQADCSVCKDSLCNACTDFSENGCKTCKINASFQSNSCMCNNGYNGTISCNPVEFSVNLLVSNNDNLSLDFSDPLQYSLTNQSFQILIENDPEFTWSLEQINTSYYNIQLKIKDKVEKNAIINITFFDLIEVKSIYNGILNYSTITSKLYEYDPTSYTLAVAAITSQATAAVQSAVIGSIALSFLNPNPSSLWGLLSCLQILSYLSLSGIPFSSKMNEFLSNLSSYNLFPNIFEYFIDEKEGNKAYAEALNFGYNTDLILLNQGDDFSIIAASMLLLPFAGYFAGCSYRKVGKKFQKIFKNYKYNFFIRFWIQCYLELGTAAYIGLKMFKGNNLVQITNIAISFVMALLFTISPFAFLWFSYRNQLKIQRKSKKFSSLFDSFFYEFRTEKGFLYSLYYFVYFLRKLIYSTNLVFLSANPRTQVAINIICSLLSVFYLLVYWPFKDIIIQISNLASEIIIWIIMCATSFYLFDISSSLTSDLENFIIFASLITVGLQFCISIAILIRTFYQIFGYKLIQYRNGKLKVHPTEVFSETFNYIN